MPELQKRGGWKFGTRPCCWRRRYGKSPRENVALPFAYPLIATLLLTGGARRAVRSARDGLPVEANVVDLKPNVPLHPQLEEILREYDKTPFSVPVVMRVRGR
jgi:hypothetical protein